MNTDPRIDAYIARAADFAQPLLAHLRSVVHAACPEVQETLKWSMPFFVHQGRNLAHMAAFKAHCGFGIWVGVAGQKTEQAREAMGNFGRIAALSDLPPRRELMRLLKSGVAAIEAGEASPRMARPAPGSAPKAALPLPPDLAAGLAAQPEAQRHFDAFAPGHRREYIEWITGAKREDTRARRLAQALDQLAEGMHLNWKYER